MACQSTDLQSCHADFGDCAADEVHLEETLHNLAVGGSVVAHGRHHCQPAQQLRVKYALNLMSLPFACLMHTLTFSSCG